MNFVSRWWALGIMLSIALQGVESQAQNRGRVLAAPCPHSCRTLGIEKFVCRDWREGNTCYVEDLRYPPSSPTRRPTNPRPPVYPTVGQPVAPSTPVNGISADEAECRDRARHYLARPRVQIDRVKPTGNIFGDKVKVEGTVEGVCLIEAGLFEDGRKEQEIRIVTTPVFRRFEFGVRTRVNNEPEIRVYNIAGDRDEAEVRSAN